MKFKEDVISVFGGKAQFYSDYATVQTELYFIDIYKKGNKIEISLSLIDAESDSISAIGGDVRSAYVNAKMKAKETYERQISERLKNLDDAEVKNET